MTGWNLPPGCNESDIPGNRPDDLRQDALYDKIYDALVGLQLEDNDQKMEAAAELLFNLCGDVYQEGYAAGCATVSSESDGE